VEKWAPENSNFRITFCGAWAAPCATDFFSKFSICGGKILNLPYIFTLFEFCDSKNCPAG
jgi:hypothetical protein